jgi:Uma2 family endonuclease
MNIALRKPWTLPEFLAWEERQDLRYEFDGIRPVAMVGGTAAHNIIILNIAGTLRDRLRGKPCRAFAETVKIEVVGRIRYPDVVVTCSPVRANATVIPSPVVIFEVLSDSTARMDRTEKNAEYRDTPSVMRYVMLEQDAVQATMFTREGERWVGTLLGADAVIDMPEIGAAISLAEAYEGVPFGTAEDGGATQ